MGDHFDAGDAFVRKCEEQAVAEREGECAAGETKRVGAHAGSIGRPVDPFDAGDAIVRKCEEMEVARARR